MVYRPASAGRFFLAKLVARGDGFAYGAFINTMNAPHSLIELIMNKKPDEDIRLSSQNMTIYLGYPASACLMMGRRRRIR